MRLRMHLYPDFNILHFKEKLEEHHGITLSYETLRKLLIKRELHVPKTRKRVYRRRRRRMPRAGLLVQMDSSKHRWIPQVEREWWLIAMIDDADGYVSAAFHPEESTEANMEVFKAYIRERGIFMALSTDRASHFTTTRHGGLNREVNVEEKSTQIAMALEELGIAHVTASSPQAKGRIERLFRFFQDRLIKEIRLWGVTDYESANRFLRETFLPWYNERYTFRVESTYQELPEGIDLDLVFSLRHSRKARKDNTTSYEGTVYQLFPAHGIKG